LNSEQLSLVENFDLLTLGELENVLLYWVLAYVSVSSVRHVLFCGDRRLQEDFEAFYVLELLRDLVNELAGRLGIQLFLASQIVERRVHEFKLLALGDHEVVLIEPSVHHSAYVLLFMKLGQGLARGEERRPLLDRLGLEKQSRCLG